MIDIGDWVKFDRATDESFCACIPGTFNTTQKDLHGHIIPEDKYPEYIKMMSQDPERRIVSVHHDRDDPVGEIIWAGIREDKDFFRLVGGIGIYESARDRLEEIENLGGFSVSLTDFQNISEEDWDPEKVNFKYEGLGEDFQALHETISDKDVPARFEIQKSAAGAFLLDVIANDITTLIELAMIVYSIHRSRRESEEESEDETEPQVVVNGHVIVLGNKDTDELLESLSEAIGQDVWLDPDTAEELVEAIEDEEADIDIDVNPEFE